MPESELKIPSLTCILMHGLTVRELLNTRLMTTLATHSFSLSGIVIIGPTVAKKTAGR